MRLLPEGRPDPILAFFGRMNVAHAKARAVGVETYHIYLARNIYCCFETIGLRYQKIGSITAIASALYAEPFRVGNAHLNQFICSGGHPFDPGFAGITSFQSNRWLYNGIAIRRENVDRAIKVIIKELLIDIKNAFNTISRKIMLENLYKHPSLSALFKLSDWAYSSSTPIFFRNDAGDIVTNENLKSMQDANNGRPLPNSNYSEFYSSHNNPYSSYGNQGTNKYEAKAPDMWTKEEKH